MTNTSRRLDLGVAFLVLLPVWISSPLPLQDLPSHEHVVAALANGLEWTGFADRLRIDWTPRPYAVVYFAWAGLAKAVGVDLASRLLLSFALAGGVLTASRLIRRLDPRKPTRAALVALFAFSEFYYLGFVHLLVGLPFAFLLLERRVPHRESPRPWRDEATDALLLLAAYLCHPLAGFPAGVVLGVFTLRSSKDPRRIARGLGRLALVALPCVLWAAAVALFGRDRPFNPDNALEFLSPPTAVAMIVCAPVAAHGTFLFWPVGGAARVLALLNLCAWGLGMTALAWRKGPIAARAPQPGLGWAIAAMVAFVFVFPDRWHDGSALSIRGLLFLFPLLLAWAPVREETRATTILTAVALLVYAATAVGAHALAAREVRRVDPIFAAMEPGAAVLPLGTLSHPAFRPPRSQVVLGYILDLHVNAAVRYHVTKGGLGPPVGAIIHSTSAVEVVDPLPLAIDPVYRYLVAPITVLRPPPNYREVPTSSTHWRLFERLS